MNNLNLDTITKGRDELAGEGSFDAAAEGSGGTDDMPRARSPRRAGQSYDNSTSELKEKSDDEALPHRRYRSQSQYEPGIEAALPARDERNESDVVTNLNDPAGVVDVFEGRVQREVTLTEQRRLRLRLLQKLMERSVLGSERGFVLPQGRSAWVRFVRSLDV